jgi:aspartyl-tRNA(Asn)/glutamyl-tRNA(Gln) amidotransferase subunit C
VSVSEQDVRHVAGLARLGIAEPSLPALVEELNGILEHMDVLQQVNIDDASLEPDAEQGMRLRPDVASPIPLQRERASFAPSMRDGFFLVPRLETHDDTPGTVDASPAAAPE